MTREWTIEEKAQLSRLVERFGRCGQWEAIAAALGTGRPASACLKVYATDINGLSTALGFASSDAAAATAGTAATAAGSSRQPDLPATRTGLPIFTPQMDEMLREQVQALGPRWRLIGQRMGLDRKQVYWRWDKVLRSAARRGPWGVGEDLLLLTGIARMGLRWDLVAQVRRGVRGCKGVSCGLRAKAWMCWRLHACVLRLGSNPLPCVFVRQVLPGRSARQCRERWVEVLDPRVDRGPWTAPLLEKLKEVSHGDESRVCSK